MNIQAKAALAAMAASLVAAGCSGPADAPEPDATDAAETAEVAPIAETAPSPAANDFADWAGRWTGVEGMFLDIQPTGNGAYWLEMQYDLDNYGTYDGTPAQDGIAFEREGETLLLRAGNGEETGLKYLADKQDCLIVARGEGYCRD